MRLDGLQLQEEQLSSSYNFSYIDNNDRRSDVAEYTN